MINGNKLVPLMIFLFQPPVLLKRRSDRFIMLKPIDLATMTLKKYWQAKKSFLKGLRIMLSTRPGYKEKESTR